MLNVKSTQMKTALSSYLNPVRVVIKKWRTANAGKGVGKEEFAGLKRGERVKRRRT